VEVGCVTQGADSWWWKNSCFDGCVNEEDDGEKMEVLRRGGSAVSGEFQW